MYTASTPSRTTPCVWKTACQTTGTYVVCCRGWRCVQLRVTLTGVRRAQHAGDGRCVDRGQRGPGPLGRARMAVQSTSSSSSQPMLLLLLCHELELAENSEQTGAAAVTVRGDAFHASVCSK